MRSVSGMYACVVIKAYELLDPSRRDKKLSGYCILYQLLNPIISVMWDKYAIAMWTDMCLFLIGWKRYSPLYLI